MNWWHAVPRLLARDTRETNGNDIAGILTGVEYIIEATVTKCEQRRTASGDSDKEQ
jgi:hypothetical protein